MSLINKTKQLSAFSIILLILLPSSLAFSLKPNLPLAPLLSGGNDRFTFTGQEKDATGLMYYGARYYDPFLRHFTQADTVIGDVYDPQQLNRYAYARNNPVKYADPSGNAINLVTGAVGFGFGFLAGFGVSVYDQWTSGEIISLGQAAKTGLVTGTIGGVVGITLGLAAPLIPASVTATATSIGATSVGLIGPELTSIIAGGTISSGIQSTSNAISGQPLMQGIDRAFELGAVGGLIGGGMGGAVGGVGVSGAWHKGSFSTPKQNFDYHYKIQGSGLTKSQYTKAAQQLWTKFGSPKPIKTTYTLIGPEDTLTTPTGRSIPGFKILAPNQELGIYDDVGKIVTYHPPKK